MEGLGRNAGPTWGEQVGGGERVGREVWRPAAKGPSVTLVISLLGGKTVPVGFPETRSSLTLALAPTQSSANMLFLFSQKAALSGRVDRGPQGRAGQPGESTMVLISHFPSVRSPVPSPTRVPPCANLPSAAPGTGVGGGLP